MRKFLELFFIRNQLFHFIQVIKLIDDYNPVPFVKFCDFNAIVFSQIIQGFPFIFVENFVFFEKLVYLRYRALVKEGGPYFLRSRKNNSNEYLISYTHQLFFVGRQKRNLKPIRISRTLSSLFKYDKKGIRCFRFNLLNFASRLCEKLSFDCDAFVSPVLKCPMLFKKTKRGLHDRKAEPFKSITSSNHSRGPRMIVDMLTSSRIACTFLPSSGYLMMILDGRFASCGFSSVSVNFS